jgi:hypothetical protein
MNKDARITGILSEFGEDLSSTWLVQGQRVIYHSALERIAAKARIEFERPEIIRAEEREAVVLVTANRLIGTSEKGEYRTEWSIGEANMELNYRTSGKQQAYPYAMAEKRAKDRVILKLIQLHGLLYSEEEADEFKESAAGERREVMSDAISSGKPIVLDDGVVHPGDALKRMIQEQSTAAGVKNLLLRHEIQVYLSGIPEDQKNELRDFAKSRMVDLGWGKRAND